MRVSIETDSSTLTVSWGEEENRFESSRHGVWPERVRVSAGLLQTQPAQSLLPREDIDPRVRLAARVIRTRPREESDARRG